MLSGLLFGYDQGVISGALDGIEKEFSVGTILLEVITSWVTLGAMVGALAAGAVADRVGRRRTILLAGVLFVAGSLIEALAPGAYVLVLGRVVIGFGVGVASVAAPLYAAETAPARFRGRMVSLYQLAITIGIFVAYFVDYLLTHSDDWRVMLGISAVPGVLLLIVMFPLRTPALVHEGAAAPRGRGGAGQGRAGRGRGRRARPHAGHPRPRGGPEHPLGRGLRRPVAPAPGHRGDTGGVAAVDGDQRHHLLRRQDLRRRRVPLPASQSLATLWAIGAVNVVATLVAVAWVDHFGRKPLLMTGSIGMFASLVVVGAMFLKMKHGVSATDTVGPGHGDTLVALVVFIASFAFSLGPVVWTIINEIYPAQVRGKGVAVATAANWFAAWLVSQFFLSLVSLISETGVFWLFAFFCLVTYWFVHRFVPETKGKSLEQLQACGVTRTPWPTPSARTDPVTPTRGTGRRGCGSGTGRATTTL